MDPNVTLDTILENINYFLDQEEPYDEVKRRETHQEEFARVMEICEKFNALHHWLMRGGYLPDRWKDNRKLGVFLKGNLTEGFKAVGPLPYDEAFDIIEEGWVMELTNNDD